MANIVHVVGTGTIGEPIIGLIAKHRKDLGIDEVTFYKHSPRATDRPMVQALQRAGARLAVASEKKADFEKIGLTPDLEMMEAMERAGVIVDCSPGDQGLANKEAYYAKLADGRRVFMAQGSEDGFGKKYALGVNDEHVDPAVDKFVHVVSCNTHNLCALTKLIGFKNGENLLEEGRVVLIRRAGDVSDSKFIQAPTVDRHKEARGTHHATDAADLFESTMGLDVNLFSSSMKLNTAYMHTMHFHFRLKEATSRDAILEAFRGYKYAATTEKNATNQVFSFAREHGPFGRILSEAVLVAPSLHVSEDGRDVTGFAFTAQDGNALLSSIAVATRAFHPGDWHKRMEAFDGYLLREY